MLISMDTVASTMSLCTVATPPKQTTPSFCMRGFYRFFCQSRWTMIQDLYLSLRLFCPGCWHVLFGELQVCSPALQGVHWKSGYLEIWSSQQLHSRGHILWFQSRTKSVWNEFITMLRSTCPFSDGSSVTGTYFAWGAISGRLSTSSANVFRAKREL